MLVSNIFALFSKLPPHFGSLLPSFVEKLLVKTSSLKLLKIKNHNETRLSFATRFFSFKGWMQFG